MFNTLERELIRRLQGDLKLEAAPFSTIAQELGVSEDEVLDTVKGLEEKGALRRLGALLYHRKAGFSANAMVVWVVPEGRIDEAAEIMCKEVAVSHCYQRPTYPGWPYNLFTMVHGRNREQCEATIKKIADATKLAEYEILYSTHELKKSSMVYFTDEEGVSFKNS